MQTINSPLWHNALKNEFEKPYFKELSYFVDKEYSEKTIFPPYDAIFNAFELTPLDKVKAVILGQDPYHTPGAAMGLSFSVPKDEKIPPSLANIYKAIKLDLGYEIPSHGCLTKWAKEGVLMLNTVLTVESGKANSHKNKGWETFTDKVIKILNDCEQPIVFLLWGTPARKKSVLLKNPRHLVLESVHPSPLSAYHGFYDCRHFSRANEFLKKNDIKEIDWKID